MSLYKGKKFLILGGGSIGKRHIKNLQALGIETIYCLKREKDAAFEQETKSKVITGIDELPAGELIDAVIVCTPTSLHNEGIKIAASLNAAVFMEKPLINGAQGLKEASLLLQNTKHPFFIGFMLRYHPLVKKIKEVIASEVLGKVYSARFEFGSYLPYWHPWEDHKISYASKAALGGGVINTITHELDLIQFFFGNPAAVSCVAANFKKLGIEVEEMAEAVLEYEDKLVTLHLDYLQKDYDRNISILCDEGSIKWNWHQNKVVVKKHKEEIMEYPLAGFDVNQLYIDELNDFLDILKDKQLSHPLDKDHAISNTEVLLKMHESAQEGRKVKVK